MKTRAVTIITAITILALCLPLRAQERTVILATSDWEPYYGENLRNNGFVTHLATEAFQRSGYRLNMLFIAWNRAMAMGRKGECHGVLGAHKTTEREKLFLFSDPVTDIQQTFLAKRDTMIRVTKLTDLSPYTIGVIRGYSYTEEFSSARYLKREIADGLEHNIMKLIIGRIDLVIDSEKVLMHMVQHRFPQQADELVTLKPFLKKSPIYLMFSRQIPDKEALADAFNRGFRSMREDGTMEKILRFHGF